MADKPQTARCSECGQAFADKANEAKCSCSCHAPVPNLPRVPWFPPTADDLALRGLLEFGG